MDVPIKHAATIAAVALAITAFAALSMGRMVLAGTLLVFTAFAIYVREQYK